MTRMRWVEMLREVAGKANPVLAAHLERLARRHDATVEDQGEWIAPPVREPGQEG
jgi:hypothetical protein